MLSVRFGFSDESAPIQSSSRFEQVMRREPGTQVLVSCDITALLDYIGH